MGGAYGTHGRGRGTCRVLVGRPEGRNYLEDPDADGRDLQEVEWEGVNWIELAQDRDR